MNPAEVAELLRQHSELIAANLDLLCAIVANEKELLDALKEFPRS